MSLFAELKRRNVIRVAIAYAIVAWVIAQIAEFAFENFGAPDWVLKSVVVLLLLGLPIALIFAWAFEMTPEGIKREKEVDRSQSIVAQTGHKLDRMIIGVLVIALAWFAWDKFYVASQTEPGDATAVQADREIPLTDKSVAVLPFVAMSSGPDDEYFADGLTEEILNSLAQLPELLVTARTSAFSFKGQDIPIQEIASALGVEHVVEGSVRRSGERLRVTAQLIRADDGFHLWSENYDSSSQDTISVQENIAEQIAAALDVVLDEEKRAAMRAAGLRDVEAFTFYQKGLERFAKAHGEMDQAEGLRQANVYFEEVISRVPDFAQVYLDHSDLFVHRLNDSTTNVPEWRLTEKEAAETYAAALTDYERAEQYASNPDVRLLYELDRAYFSGDWRKLRRNIKRALQTPGCAEGNWLHMVALAFDFAAAQLERSKQMLTCEPRRSQTWFTAARAALRSGDKDEALRLAAEGSKIAPGSWLSSEYARILAAHGRYAEALQEIDRHLNERELALFFRALVEAARGDRAAYDAAYEAFEEVNDYGDYWSVAISAAGGQREKANEAAARIDEHFFGPVVLVQIVTWCTCGAPFDLGATPNFAARIEESGLPWPPKKVMEFPLKDW